MCHSLKNQAGNHMHSKNMYPQAHHQPLPLRPPPSALPPQTQTHTLWLSHRRKHAHYLFEWRLSVWVTAAPAWTSIRVVRRCVASTRVKEPLHFTMDFHFEIAQNKFIPQNFNSIRIDRFRGWPFVCPEAIHRMTVLADVCCDRRCGLVALSKMRTRDLEIFRNGSFWQNIAMSMKVLVSSEIFKW